MINRELNFFGNSPLLYLIATPIGNLGEMTPRALEVLKEIDYVACEDTRNSGSLLKKFGLDKQFISCHEHNEEEEAGTAPLVKSGRLSHILHIQLKSAFYTVDTFMLCAMIHEHPLDILCL